MEKFKFTSVLLASRQSHRTTTKNNNKDDDNKKSTVNTKKWKLEVGRKKDEKKKN